MTGLWLSSWFSLSTRLILSLGNGRNVSFVLVFVDMLGNDASWKGQSLRTEAPPRHHSSLAGGSRGQAVTRNSKRFTVLATPVRQPKLSLIDSNSDNFVNPSNLILPV